MTMSNVATGDVIRATDHNSIVDFLKGGTGTGEQMKLVYNSESAILIQPSSDPSANTDAIEIHNNAGTQQAAITFDGRFKAHDGAVGSPGLTFDDDTDTGLYRSAANTIDVSAGGVRAAQFSTVSSAVNYLDIAPAIATADPTITAEGTDTNIDVNIVPKGSGTLLVKGVAVQGVVTSATALLGADVSMVSANTWYDGPSVSLAAGTWFVTATATTQTVSTNVVDTGRISDGTTHYASTAMGWNTTVGYQRCLSMSAIIVLGSTTTIKVQAATNGVGSGAGTLHAAALANGVGNNATHICAIKIA